MKEPLTTKQADILDQIKAYIEDKGYAPTLRELSTIFKKTEPTIFGHIEALKKKGWVKGSGRKMRVVK